MKPNRSRVAAPLVLSLLSPLLGCERGPHSASEATDADRQRAVEELADATTAMRDMVQAGTIPPGQASKARCVAVIPSLVSGALVVGARHGRGVVTCRTAAGWSGPAFVTVSGGSAGLQIGVESSDLAMLVMSDRGMAQLFRSSFELGGDTSVAAGPVGHSAQAATDAQMTAEILSYARTRGLFAGVELSGVIVKQDAAAATALYGSVADVHGILGGDLSPPKEAQAFLDEMRAALPLEPQSRPPVSSTGP